MFLTFLILPSSTFASVQSCTDWNVNSPSFTISHTVAQSENNALVVSINTRGTEVNQIASVKFNGVPLQFGNWVAGSGNASAVYYLVSPTVGEHLLEVLLNSNPQNNNNNWGTVCDYSGVEQSGTLLDTISVVSDGSGYLAFNYASTVDSVFFGSAHNNAVAFSDLVGLTYLQSTSHSRVFVRSEEVKDTDLHTYSLKSVEGADGSLAGIFLKLTSVPTTPTSTPPTMTFPQEIIDTVVYGGGIVLFYLSVTFFTLIFAFILLKI